jgi:hypothetical protein
MKVTDVTYGSGRWTLTGQAPDGTQAKINCGVKSGKLVGEWVYGDNHGKFEFNRMDK